VVDDGAAVALRERNRSLLPAGITEVVGTFARGDIISILDSQRVQAACGIANYASGDVDKIKGLRSDRIREVLKRQFGDEVVHRNNMVVL
jgi:glutamate 5-kinase